MKVILYMAVTVDGFIATKNGDSDWVSEVDVPIFDKKIKEFGCIVLGNKTFQQYRGKYFPKKDAINVVLTHKVLSEPEKGVVFVNSPKEAIEFAQNKDFKRILLIGGGLVNASFLKENLIDEVYLDIHPLIFGEGIRVFEDFETNIQLEKIDFEMLDEGQILLHYKVIK